MLFVNNDILLALKAKRIMHFIQLYKELLVIWSFIIMHNVFFLFIKTDIDILNAHAV